jgi:alpha-glucosidase
LVSCFPHGKINCPPKLFPLWIGIVPDNQTEDAAMTQPKPASLRVTFAVSLLLLPGVQARGAETELLRSPDGTAQVTVGIKQKSEGLSRLCYAVRFGGKDVLLDSPFRLEFGNRPMLAGDLTIQNVTRRAADEHWQRLYGKRKQVRNHFNEMTLELRETSAPNRSFQAVFRAYNDGIAFRYRLPEAWGAFDLAAERNAFRFPDDVSVWAANFGGFHSSQESQFNRMKLSELVTNQVYGCPLLVELDASLWAACTEADLSDWAGMYFTPVAGESNTVCTALSPHPDETNVVVRSTAPRSSPWRVILLGDRPGALIESDILENLNPPAPFDAAWVKPGKAAWDRWWSGGYAPEVDFKVGMNTATMKYFVDLAAEMGWQYQIVDEGWYGDAFAPGTRGTTWAPHPAGNLTNVVPELDLHGLISYAHKRGVRLILWLHWGHVDQQMGMAFATYERWGISGVKIDFMDRDDQYMVRYYERVAKLAAAHHLLVDFHGAYKPTGWHRTYPNVITREGVLGNEYNKWSTNVTPEHTLTLPFTRGLLGGMDFTPGGFRQKTLESFRALGGDAPGPFVIGTRVHQIAMLVVYESALQVLCDSPYNYHSSPAGADFLKIVPTTWDDTKVIHGDVGKYITVVRRSGEEWFVGSMTGTDARTLEIPLSFLGQGKYRAEIWADAYEAADFPDRLMKRQRIVTATDTLKATLAPAGGYVAWLRPR